MLELAIAGFIALIIIFIFVYVIGNSEKTESWKKLRTPARTAKYIREKIKIENKHCSKLPALDSRGIYSGATGSFTDKTGKFSKAYQKDINELNKEFGIGFDDV